MRLQQRMHLNCDAAAARRVWETDRSIRAALAESLGIAAPVKDCTPPGSSGLGIRWKAVGDALRCGFMPVSDGTDVVVQWTQGLGKRLDPVGRSRNRKRFQAFCRLLRDRLEARS